MVTGFLILALLALIVLLLWGKGPAPGDWVTLPDGRRYLAVLPRQSPGAPLIVALHGGGGQARTFAAKSGLAPAATAAGYAVIFPDGTGPWNAHTFNAGYCCGTAARDGVDDLSFLDAAIADAKARYRLDPGPVVITGVSNGAMLAEAYAATRPQAVRAVAAVAGTLDLARFPPRGPVPLFILHGSNDRNVPLAGGLGPRARNRVPFTPVQSVVEAFLRPWGTANLERTQRETPRDAEGFALKETTWSRAGHPVLRLLIVEGGDHDWPGAAPSARRQGRSPSTLSANAEILRFLDELGHSAGGGARQSPQ